MLILSTKLFIFVTDCLLDILNDDQCHIDSSFRYGYNMASGTCVKFSFCPTNKPAENENNFEKLEDCESLCTNIYY